AGESDWARRDDVPAGEQHERERSREVMGEALLEPEGAGAQAEPVLKNQGARDGRPPGRRDRDRRRRHRPRPDHADRHLTHAISLMPTPPAPARRCAPSISAPYNDAKAAMVWGR